MSFVIGRKLKRLIITVFVLAAFYYSVSFIQSEDIPQFYSQQELEERLKAAARAEQVKPPDVKFKGNGEEEINKETDEGQSKIVPQVKRDRHILPAGINHFFEGKCPSYLDYSTVRHPPYSVGPLKLPYQRPQEHCIKFKSPEVEEIIKDFNERIENPDLARLFENTFPNTLDTTVLWHTDSDYPQTFIVTGDIHAEWLRDSTWQLSPYIPLASKSTRIQKLILGAINTQASFVSQNPYCNAFHPPPGSGISKGKGQVDLVSPRPDWSKVFECKWEIDSLASFLTLSNEYYKYTEDISFLDKKWLTAYNSLFTVLNQQSYSSYTPAGNVRLGFYKFQRNTNIGTETLSNYGLGNPVNDGTGMIRSAFRPSDDATIYQFFIPGNAHMAVELNRTAILFEQLGKHDLAKAARTRSKEITKGIWEHGVYDHPKFGKVFAYEVDGFGSVNIMDDANVPSLLSLPILGFLDRDNEIYQNTRKMILSKQGNPYYLKGKVIEGIGGPHVGMHHPWPMSLIIQARTSNSIEEIQFLLKQLIKSTDGLGLMHEGVSDQPSNKMHGLRYTRSWFSWCNSEFGKLILWIAQEYPELIFTKEYSKLKYSL